MDIEDSQASNLLKDTFWLNWFGQRVLFFCLGSFVWLLVVSMLFISPVVMADWTSWTRHMMVVVGMIVLYIANVLFGAAIQNGFAELEPQKLDAFAGFVVALFIEACMATRFHLAGLIHVFYCTQHCFKVMVLAG